MSTKADSGPPRDPAPPPIVCDPLSAGPPPDQLAKRDIVCGIRPIRELVQACYERFRLSGLANVTITIAKTGRISNASVSGRFSGTPTGACVAAAVREAQFPAFTGAAQTIVFPFMLREPTPADDL